MGPKKRGGKKDAKEKAPDEHLTDGYEAGWDMRESTSRLRAYAAASPPVSNLNVYESECERLDKKPNSAILELLKESEPGVYDLKELNFNGNLLGTLTPILDLIHLNKGITKLLLKDNGIQNNAVPLLAQVLVDHPSIEVIDLTGNKHVGYVAGKALLMLLERNENLHSVRIGKTGMPPQTKEKIETLALMNFNRYMVSRKDYLSIRCDFRMADMNKNGTVALSELVGHEKHKLETKLQQKAKKTGDAEKDKAAAKQREATVKAAEKKIKEAAEKMFTKLDRDGDQKLSFPEFMRFYYPKIPEATLALFIQKYEKEEKEGKAAPKLSEDACIELFDKYDVDGDGGLTKSELQQGLLAHQSEIDDMFREYDLDGGDQLALGEFIMLMTKRGHV